MQVSRNTSLKIRVKHCLINNSTRFVLDYIISHYILRVHESLQGEQRYRSTKGVGGQRHALSAVPQRKRPCTHCTGGWVGTRSVLIGCEKFRRQRDSIRTDYQLRYTGPYRVACKSRASGYLSHTVCIMDCNLHNFPAVSKFNILYP
jgi:hypothetical protein